MRDSNDDLDPETVAKRQVLELELRFCSWVLYRISRGLAREFPVEAAIAGEAHRLIESIEAPRVLN